MSSSDQRPQTPDPRRVAIVLLALPLGACFQPMYGEAAHPGLVAEMRSISVEPIKDRIGHYLGNDLITVLNGTGSNPEPKYKLIVTTTTATGTPTVKSQLQVANAATVTATATYKLTPASGGDVLLSGQASAVSVYDRTEQRFSNLRAQRDTDIRLAKALSEEIELRIAAWFSEQKK